MITREEYDKLSALFPDEDVKQIEGYDYLEAGLLIKRLNTITNGNWACRTVSVREYPVTEKVKVYAKGSAPEKTLLRQNIQFTATVELVIAGMAKEATGGSSLNFRKDSEDTTPDAYIQAVKAAETDALKRAMRLFGLGLQCWRGGHPDELPAHTYETNGHDVKSSATERVEESVKSSTKSSGWRKDCAIGVGKLLERLVKTGMSADDATRELETICTKYHVAGLDDPDLTEKVAGDLFSDLKVMTMRLERNAGTRV